MSRIPVSPDLLEVFAEAGRLGSFKAAAESLSVTTSAVSQSIRKLEDRLNLQLFNRIGPRLEITEQGKVLLVFVDAGLEQMRLGLEMLKALNDKPISISGPPSISSQLISPVIQRLLGEDYSDIRFTTIDKPDNTTYRNFDVSIVYGEKFATHPGLESLGPDVFVPVARADVAAQITSLQDMFRFRLLENEGSGVSWSDWLMHNRITPPTVSWLRFDRGTNVITALRDGHGVSIESLRLLSPYLETGELTICPIPGIEPLRKRMTFLYRIENPTRREQASRIAALLKSFSQTNEDGFRTLKSSEQMHTPK